MFYALCLALFAPFFGFLSLLIGSSRLSRQAAASLACSTVFFSFLCFIFIFRAYCQAEEESIIFFLYPWIVVKGFQADVTLLLDSLSLWMGLIITGIGFVIHLYSIGYMSHEKDFARYFACLNFFLFAMLLLVFAANLLLLFVGWEGVGLASYLLIGFWHQRPKAANAAFKAFVVNRIGDAGLLLGILLAFHAFGTSDINRLSQMAQQTFAIGAPILTVLTLLCFWGATGKSAQLPLQTWLPDAMEGPTPVSALIHAATMVTAGVYLTARMHGVFIWAPLTLNVISYVGAATSLFAALCAWGQTDLKRVLAYSTMSQLGFMFFACGVGAFYAAMFHLTTHAFVKALLFLSAGNVVHMLHGLTDMRQMGGLSKIFTKTHWLFLIGALALSGIPPMAPFFSKELILEQEHLAGFNLLFYMGVLVSFLTAVYLARAYILTFAGKPRLNEQDKEATEAPLVMQIPLYLLAAASFGGGFLGWGLYKMPFLQAFLNKAHITLAVKEPTNLLFLPETWAIALCAGIGAASSAALYLRFADKAPKLSLFRREFFINELYRKCLTNPVRSFAGFIARYCEERGFEGSLRGAARAAQKTACGFQKMQSGQIRSYAAWLAIGAAVFILYAIF